MKPWYLYIVLCRDSTLYTGITTDISRRIKEHNSGRGAKYTKGRGPVQLVHMRQCRNRSDASKLESKFKKLRRKKKLKIIQDIAMPGEIVQLAGYSNSRLKYAMVVKVIDYAYGKYTRDGAVSYEMSNGRSGFSYVYKKLHPRCTI